MLKLKHALWFAAAVGDMQFSWLGRWAHPYLGISLTFQQCRDVLPYEEVKLFQALIPTDHLANLDAMSAYLFK